MDNNNEKFLDDTSIQDEMINLSADTDCERDVLSGASENISAHNTNNGEIYQSGDNDNGIVGYNAANDITDDAYANGARDDINTANDIRDADTLNTHNRGDNENTSTKQSTIDTNADEQEHKYTLQNFDNPYELLLAIMEDKKVDLKTVQLSEITDEYLEYIHSCDNINLEEASEFITVASTLLEIKVKALLPKPEDPVDEDFDPEKELLRKIEEYKIMKEAAEELRAIEDVDRFYKEPEESASDYRFVLKQMDMDNLLNALTKMLIKLQQKTTISQERKIEKDRFTVADKIFSIKILLSESKQMHFSQMFDADFTRSEIISTFQAMLELMKVQFLKTRQDSLFDDILLIYNEDYVEGAQTETYDNYDE